MNIKNYLNFFVLISISLFTACQSESVVEIYNTNETITKTTPLSTYLERVAMQKTSQDNIIDKTNCFMIKFPYVVSVNYSQITLNSTTDYQLVLNNINAYSNDNDIVRIYYPITVILNNYSEKVLDSQTAFNNLITQCQSNTNDFGKINCLTINFPIAISVYDSNKQIASTSSITSNQLLYSFFENLEDNKFIAINYPINITNSNGQIITITTNNQLENIIKSLVNTCPDNINPSLDFVQILTSASWKISYYFNDTEKTSNYSGYSFAFYSDYKVVAVKSGISYNGTWSTKIDNGVREFEIKMETDPLHNLDEGWKLLEFNSSQLRFRHEDGINENEYLYFEKNN